MTGHAMLNGQQSRRTLNHLVDEITTAAKRDESIIIIIIIIAYSD